MNKYLLISLLLILSFPLYAISAFPRHDPKADQIFISLRGTNSQISLAEFMKLNPAGYKKITGKKPNLKEWIVLKISQKQLQKTIRRDGTVDMLALQARAKESFKWHWGGFFLGMLAPVGFIITLFIKDKKRKNRIISALIGMLLVLSIGIMIGGLIAASSI